MPANTSPRFTLNGNNSSDGATAMAPTFTTAAGDYVGTDLSNKIVFTADATNGSRVCGLRFKAIGTNVASVARIYLNNGSVTTSPGNNSFFGEQSLPATTASATAATVDLDYYFPGGYIDLEAGFRILVGLGTTVAAGWVVTPILGGDF